MLELVTEKARRGELVNCAIVCIDVKDAVMRGVSTPENNPFMLLGNIEVLKKEIMDRVFNEPAREIARFD